MKKRLYQLLAVGLLGYAIWGAIFPAATQTTGTISNHFVAVGRGPGVIGLGGISPGTSGWVMISQGPAADPIFGLFSPTLTGNPLTFSADTNLSFTLGGSPANALLQSVSISPAWVGNLSVSRGGTGQSSFTAGSIVWAPSAAGGLASSGVMVSNGPAFGSTAQGISTTAAGTDGQIIFGQTGAPGLYKTVTGDISFTAAGASQIRANTVSNWQLSNVATSTFKGRTTGGSGSPEDLTATQATALLNNFVGDSGSGGTKGLVPAPAAGDAAAGRFLNSNGTWSVPPGSGGSGGTVFYPQGRCSLLTGVSITTTDIASGISAYYMPYTGSYIPITGDGVTFTMSAFTQMQQVISDTTKSPAAVAASSNYDYFVWNDSGTLRFSHGPAWSSSTSRGTGISTTEIDFTTSFPTNKWAIANGPAANRGTLVCSLRSNASGQWMDTVAFRWVSNVYNAVPRYMTVTDAAANWNYTTPSFRQANANTANQIDFLQSLNGGMLSAEAMGVATNSTGTVFFATGIGIDSTGTNSANVFQTQTANSSAQQSAAAFYRGYPGLGRHTAVWLELSQGIGTTTWYGPALAFQSGITGWISN